MRQETRPESDNPEGCFLVKQIFLLLLLDLLPWASRKMVMALLEARKEIREPMGTRGGKLMEQVLREVRESGILIWFH